MHSPGPIGVRCTEGHPTNCRIILGELVLLAGSTVSSRAGLSAKGEAPVSAPCDGGEKETERGSGHRG